jgi:DNA-binding response OmpR family regulator
MTRTVLVVEDDFDTQHPLAEILRLKGYAVVTASDSERGFATALVKRPDLIITDLLLPGKSGLHLIMNVRKDDSLKRIPIMVISGCLPPMLDEAKRLGADCCLQKPISFEWFWETLEHLLGRQRDSEPQEFKGYPGDAGRVVATRIDDLVEQLRKCSTEEAREDLLKLLKQQILGRSQGSGRV